MMTLRRMHQVVATLDDQWHSPLADRIVAAWPNDGSRPIYIRASANFVFVFKSDTGHGRVLRFNHESERDPTAIAAELAAVDQVAAAGTHVARPVKSAAGNWVETVATDHGTFHAAAFERIFGEQTDLDAGLTDAQWRHWGRALAQVHNTLAATTAARPSWQDHADQAKAALHDDPALSQVLQQITRDLHALPHTTENFGLIHFDFELDNIVWRDGAPVAIDFDDCAHYWYAADIAYALRDLFDDDATNVDLDHPRLRLFVAGYRAARAMSDADLANLPLFLRFHHLLGLARLRHAMTPAEPGEPDWVPDLRAKLAATAARHRATLLV